MSFQPESVDTLVRSFGVNPFQAVGIVLAVALAFLGVRAGLVVASLVPAAMVMALPMISFFEVGINQVSLAAPIISLGMLVDNGIVITESITVQMATGRPPVEAAAGSAHELRVPPLVSSLTTAAAFLPIYLAESNVGEYAAPLFTVVTVTLLSSWILALTVTPLLCVRLLRVRPTSISKKWKVSFARPAGSRVSGLRKELRLPTIPRGRAVLPVHRLGLHMARRPHGRGADRHAARG